ncbi:TEDC2 protein, partial [Campylorhamphus procurvoides]|nr:TEDC2 protein [Campylorhamphus procurvoides]
PSPKELEELELLNRALEKALKVRKSVLKTSLEAQGTTGQKLAAGKSSSKGVASKQGGSCRTARGSAPEVCAPAEPQKTPGLSKCAPNEQQSFSARDSAGGKNSAAAALELFDAGKISCGFLGESSRKEDTASALGRCPSLGTGTLQEKGCQLKLPLPYRKAYSRNSRAWERCRLCQTSADAAAARTRFTERIQTTVSFPAGSGCNLSPAEIEEELRVLQDVPSRLRQYVEAEPADPPTLQGEYESLLTLEGLQTTVAQCLQKLQLLRADCTGDVGSCSPACVPARGQVCDPAGMLALPLLCYSSLQELRDLFALKLRVSMLHQEIALQKVLMAELLPVLEPSPCPEGSARLFRAIHTQLCQGGRSFPVLVRDELLD